MSNDASPTATVTLDGQQVAFTPGETIYEIAQRQGTFVPTLCYDPRLKPFNLARASTLPPKERGALNIEGLCATPQQQLLIGFQQVGTSRSRGIHARQTERMSEADCPLAGTDRHLFLLG